VVLHPLVFDVTRQHAASVSGPTEKNRELVQRWRAVLGGPGELTVRAYTTTDRSLRVDVFSAADAPRPGTTTYATIGLSDTRNAIGRGQNTPTELIAVGASPSDLPARTLSTVSFDHLTSGVTLAIGVAVPAAIGRNEPGAALPHAFLTDAFLWDDLRGLQVGGTSVQALLVVPISDAELRLIEAEGPAALDARFEEHEIDVADWERPSVV
jgi:Suppressor of fused protein (SUFU)